MKNRHIIGVFLVLGLFSCEDMLEPQRDNRRTEEEVLTNPSWAEGFLLEAYANLPIGTNAPQGIEYATDDAVTNNLQNGFRRMATGQWSAVFSPVSTWGDSFDQINRINFFLSKVDSVVWSSESPRRDSLFKEKHKAEAQALRAMYNFELLQRHGGEAANGEMLGYPIITEPLEIDSRWDLPRNTYQECYNQIIADLDSAIAHLPKIYLNTGDAEFDRIFGDQNLHRINGNIATAFKARVALHAGSPAYNGGTYNISLMEEAAEYASMVLNDVGGVFGLDNEGLEYYDSDDDQNSAEILWRGNRNNTNFPERSNYPPSLFGDANTNPSQNLVDAFPDANGFPISRSIDYDPNDPYANRDPRLAKYIVYNGSELRNEIIDTSVDNPNNQNGLNITPFSTRTGYYLKKQLRTDVNLDPNVLNAQFHLTVRMRYTELFLIYAEAANEVFGPDGSHPNAIYTPREVVAALRQRAGIIASDPYLASLTSPEAIRTMIQNERRIELCFEGFRFWDIRRRNQSLSEPVMGMEITDGNYRKVQVEERLFLPFMKYGPIPFNETLKYEGLFQNAGW